MNSIPSIAFLSEEGKLTGSPGTNHLLLSEWIKVVGVLPNIHNGRTSTSTLGFSPWRTKLQKTYRTKRS